MRTVCIGCLIVFFVIGSSCGLFADEPRVLDLEKLIAMALANSPELGEVEQGIIAAESDLAKATAAQWAQLDASLVGGPVNDAEEPFVVSRESPPGSGRFIGEIVSPTKRDEVSGIGPFGRLEFEIVQPLYTFGKIVYRKQAAAEGVKAEKMALEQTRGEIIRKAKTLYYSLILAQQGKKTAQETGTFYGDARKRIKKLLDLGATNVTESDLYRLEAYAAEAKRFKVKAEAGARIAYTALKRFIGFPEDQDFQLDRQELPTDTRELEEQAEYIQRALEWRPEFERLDKGIQANQHLVKAQKAELYPSIFAAAIGNISRAPGRDDPDDPYLNDDFNSTGVGVIVGAKWHFDLGITKAEIHKARAKYNKLRYTKAIAERDIPLEVIKYYQDALEQKTTFQTMQEAAVAARRWIVSAFSALDMGVGSVRDLLDAIQLYGRNQGEYLVSLLEFHKAMANLSYATAEYRQDGRER
jgi:outer membrane protein